MERKPNGFWTKDSLVRDVMNGYVRGEVDLDEATNALVEYCGVLNVSQTDADIRADVVWYARAIRKAMGLPGLRESAKIAAAKTDLEQGEEQVEG